MKHVVLILALTSLLTACFGNGLTRAYTGPELPNADVAVINCVLNISVQSIDGDTKYHGAGTDCMYAVLPGTHRVSMKFYENDYSSNLRNVEKTPHTIEFTANKGMKYYFAAFKKDNKWIFKIQEVNPDKQGASSKAAYAEYKVID